MPLIDRLLGEHRLLEQLAGEIAVSRSADSLSVFAELLRAHVRIEENELFEQIQNRLRPDTLARLGDELGGGSAPVCGVTGNP
jgi:hemerythrin-like domain-containing protein